MSPAPAKGHLERVCETPGLPWGDRCPVYVLPQPCQCHCLGYSLPRGWGCRLDTKLTERLWDKWAACISGGPWMYFRETELPGRVRMRIFWVLSSSQYCSKSHRELSQPWLCSSGSSVTLSVWHVGGFWLVCDLLLNIYSVLRLILKEVIRQNKPELMLMLVLPRGCEGLGSLYMARQKIKPMKMGFSQWL